MKTTYMLILWAWAATTWGQEPPFLGLWTNTVHQGRVTVNVTMDFRSNGVVIVSAAAAPTNSTASTYTGRYEIVGNDIVFYGESGHGFSPPQTERHQTTNVMIYSAERDLLTSKGDGDFRHPLQRQDNNASNNRGQRKFDPGRAKD